MVGMGVRAMRRRPVTGSEGMIGLVGVAKTALAPRGQIAVRGELWEAMSEDPVEAGRMVEVTAIDGLTLRVKSARDKGALR
jgi:membrane-bound serine protease (ClpP class)